MFLTIILNYGQLYAIKHVNFIAQQLKLRHTKKPAKLADLTLIYYLTNCISICGVCS